MALNINLKPQTTKVQLSFGIKSSINARSLTSLAVFFVAVCAGFVSGVASISASTSDEGIKLACGVLYVFIPIYAIANICMAVISSKISKEVNKGK